MTSNPAPDWGRIVVQTVVAGLVGAFTIDFYLWLTLELPSHNSILPVWQYVASTALGNVAYTSLSYAWIGLAIHLCVSLGWAAGYAYVAATRETILNRWLVSGIAYGLVVYLLMQVLLLASHNFVYPPNTTAFVSAVIAHTVFFGLPVAFVAYALRGRRTLVR